ncbi:glycosyltransferase family 4 protein [Colwellia sp. MEBiC06753]
MKKLIIVTTKIDGGKGGISSALAGYLIGLKRKNVEYIVVESHRDDKSKLMQWAKAFFKTTMLSFKYRKNAVFWFHGAQKTSLIRKCTLAIFPRILGAKTILHVHSPAFAGYLDNNRLFTKFILLPYKSLIALTPWWKSLLIKKGITKDIVVSANPNSDEYNNIATKSLNNVVTPKSLTEEVTILSMARMVEGKGVELVIQALAKLEPRYKLKVAGDGPKLYEYKQLVHELGLESRVEFLGWINGDDKKSLLSSADIFCLPSTYDSFGMVFIEAMAFNLPVVAYGWGPIPDVVTDDVGLCCKSATVAEVSRCIETIAKNLSNYTGKGPQRVIDNYTSDIVAENIIKLL